MRMISQNRPLQQTLVFVATIGLSGVSCGSDSTGVPSDGADAGLADSSVPAADAANPDAMPVGNQGALAFDGLDDLLVIGAFNGLSQADGYSLEAWVKPTNTAATGALLWQNRGGPGASFGMVRTSIGQGQIRVGSGSVTCTATGGTPVFVEGQWTHVAGTWDGPSGEPTLYLNGQLVDGSGCSNSMARVANDLLIGAAVINGNVTNHFEGLIDEVRIWDYERSQTEIQSGREQLLDGDETGLVAYWNFDEENGDVAIDRTGSHDARLGSASGDDDGDPQRVSDTPF